MFSVNIIILLLFISVIVRFFGWVRVEGGLGRLKRFFFGWCEFYNSNFL